MTTEQGLILAILVGAVGMFLWGRWRHDIVAAGTLIACVLTGLVPAADAFAGFGHAAVITVACVLVLSRGLQVSGAIDVMARYALPAKAGPMLSIAIVTVLAAVLSGFMNNVGALALLMPLAIKRAAQLDLPPGKILMPLAFGSILGGTTTLIGTPPNLIVSAFRDASVAGGFGMFAFTPVGATVAAVGIAFVVLVGWRLVPARQPAGMEGFETSAYLTEARVPKGSKAAGLTLGQIEEVLEQAGAQVVGLVRNDMRVSAPRRGRVVRAGDILAIEADAEALSTALSSLGLDLEEEVKKKAAQDAKKEPEERAPDDEIVLVELAVLPQSEPVGRSATDLRLRARYGINLLAVSREGRRSTARLRTMEIHAGDVLLLQGAPESISEFASSAGCLPLAERAVRIPDKRKAITAAAIMLLAVGAAAFGLAPAPVSFAAGVVASMALRTVPPRAVYTAIDWPVIVLLGALLPVAGALEATGAAGLIAQMLLADVAQGHAVLALALILVVTMTLSDAVNNAATAALMCPIAIGTAAALGVNADPFLMAVAIGASCAFLTPIGHQNNTLILGPGGFHFGDYWRLGMPLEILIVAVAIPMLLVVWPL